MSVDWILVIFDEAAKTQKADTSCREGPTRHSSYSCSGSANAAVTTPPEPASETGVGGLGLSIICDSGGAAAPVLDMEAMVLANNSKARDVPRHGTKQYFYGDCT